MEKAPKKPVLNHNSDPLYLDITWSKHRVAFSETDKIYADKA